MEKTKMSKTEKIIWLVLTILITAANVILQLKGNPSIKLPAILVNIATIVSLTGRALYIKLFKK